MIRLQEQILMAGKISPMSFKVKILGLFVALTLAGCNFPGLSPTSTTVEVDHTPTESPTETQGIEDIPTATPTVEIPPEITPTEPPPPDLPGQCRPFPDQIYPNSEDRWLDQSFWVKCGGSSDPILVRSPVKGLLWDYSNQTGKLLYGTENTAGANDPDVWLGNYTLWIYDFRTDMSTKWIQGGILEAKWASEVDNQGMQRLAVIMDDGTVGLVQGPDQFIELANIKRYDSEMDVCCITWSPKGDKLAYVKNDILYVIPTTPQEPRQMAENVYGYPVWVQDQQLLIFPSSIVKVAKADGSGPFIPQIPDGNRVWVMPERDLLWNPENRMLVFDEFHISQAQQAITWVYIFSEDFENIVEQYSCERSDASYLFSWYDQGNTAITSSGEVIRVRPEEDQITIEGVIDRIYQGRYMFWLEGDPFPRISVSLRARMEDANSNKITILDLDEGIRVRISGQSIAEGCGFLASEIQIIED
jgi:hypothetical protein